jgi:gentisate 1,2-dioxygenase
LGAANKTSTGEINPITGVLVNAVIGALLTALQKRFFKKLKRLYQRQSLFHTCSGKPVSGYA